MDRCRFPLSPVPFLLATLAHAQATVVPTDVQLPGTQPQEASLESSGRCDNCHGGYDPSVEPAFLWRGSMMAQAGRDPLFWATLAVAEQDFGGVGDFCLRCHSPEGWLDGRSTPTDGSALTAADGDGVACDLCHKMVNPDDSEHLGVQFAPFLAHDGASPPVGYYGSGAYVLFGGADKLGPYDDPVARHQALPSAFHRSSAFCGTCHDVSNPAVGDLAHNNGSPVPLDPGTFLGSPGGSVALKAAFQNPPYAYGVVERTYSEHVASALAGLPVSSYDSLPPELQAGAIQAAHAAATAAGGNGDYADGSPRTFTCQSCHLPPTEGVGCNKSNSPLRPDLPLHDLTGGSTWMPKAILALDEVDRLQLGGGLVEEERLALGAGIARARTQLQLAASLSVEGNELVIVNLTGHKLPSGYPEGRRMWIRSRWYDPMGQLLREDGAYGSLDVTIEGEPTTVETLLDLHDSETRVYAAHPGMTQEWAAQLLALGYDPDLALTFDRETGEVTATLAELAALPAGTVLETFHFVLNNALESDNRIPPYGLDRILAAERNVLPVPATLYGDPLPGTAYDHQDRLPLHPPIGAETATFELLYQSTSWEYVQFLALAGEGASAFLSDAGDALLDVWLAEGMCPPETMATAQWTALPGDCNNNGVPDVLDLASGTSSDCNGDGLPDECNIAYGTSTDENGNGVPDECEKRARRRVPAGTVPTPYVRVPAGEGVSEP